MDDDLLLLCNRAFERAAGDHCGRVEIAHVTLALTASPRVYEALEREGFRRASLTRAAERWLTTCEGLREGASPQTSGDLKELLTRAERFARARKRSFASPSDFIHALATDSADLVSATFLGYLRFDDAPATASEGKWQASEPAAEARTHAWHDTRERSASLSTHPAPSSLPNHNDKRLPARTMTDAQGGSHGGLRRPETDVPRQDQALIARLERQEQLVADLLALVSRSLAQDRSGRTSSAGGSSRSRSHRSGGLSRWRKTRTVMVGDARTRTPEVASGEGAPRPDRMLQVVVRNEPAVTMPRVRTLRDAAPDHDETGMLTCDDEVDEEADQGDRMKRFYLSPDDDIVKAPSIGPKTAARLKPVGLVLVRDLLACDPEQIASRTSNRYITATRVAEWKAQARLVCTVPWLRGTHAQLLVGAGYDTLVKLARADASAVCAAILRFVATREGQSILRSSPPPEIDRIACWIENTALAEPARAA